MMSNVQFTQSQRKAIELDGTNILVSAGAGSGKTAVLTERVIRKLRKGIRIDHLIILTFTNAAADEMKHRIKDKILQDEKLIYQLKYLDNAIISTFDSFSLRLVQTYYYLLGVPSNIQIADNVLLEKAKKDALEIILKENYQSPTNAFKTLIMSLFDKGDFTIQEGIKAFEKGLDMIPNPSDYLDQYESCFLSESFYEKTILEFESLLMEMNDELIIGYEHMIHLYDATHLISVVKYISELKNNYHIIEKIHSIDEFLSAFAILKHPSSPRFPDEEEELKQEFKKSHIMVKSTFEKIIKTVDNLFASNKESLMNSAKMIKDSILEIASLTKSYLNRKKIIMSESGLYSFSDIMNLSIKLLEENKDVREFYQNMINEIMIDEYQDTNDLQDYMISLLEKNNVFMVGDIKQSIYGFRNANPDNFYKKYIRYSNKNGGVAIDLAENFRSRKEVLEDINTIFEHIMDRDIGGIDYKQGQALIRGNLLYDRFQLHDYHTNIFQYDFDSVLEKFPEMNADTYEAKVVISDIMDKIKQGFQVVDLGGESTRNVEYRDFCILVDRKSHFDKYEDEFSQAGIPLLKIADEVFSNSIEILFIHQYLMLIKCSIDESYYNLYFKEAYYAVARSFVYQITDDLVVSYLLQKQLSMTDNWQNLLGVKEFTSIASDVIYFATHIGDLSLGNLVETIINKLNLYERVLNLSNPNSSEKKLDFLVEKVQNLSYFNLDDLIEYFDSIYDDEHMDV
ncbi:MAG: UvrD-helicase domain-containing protein, partial [Candidatus Izemoplasmatales bacterium]|nr:UvrD-helicase domain-containing protein [Candidatus Izemoplasmatales bacterium]